MLRLRTAGHGVSGSALLGRVIVAGPRVAAVGSSQQRGLVRSSTRALSDFDLYGAQRQRYDLPLDHSQYRHEVYRPEEAAEASGESAASAAAAASSAAASAPFVAGPTARSVLLSDMSRMLLGLSIVLQHSSALTAAKVSEAASTFAAQNEQNPPNLGEVARILKERVMQHAPRPPAATTTAGSASPFPFSAASLPSFVQQSVDLATSTLSQLRPNGAAAPPSFAPHAEHLQATAQKMAQDVHSAVQSAAQSAAHSQNFNDLAANVGQSVQRVGQQFNIFQPQHHAQQPHAQAPSTPVATPAPTTVAQPLTAASVFNEPKVTATVQDYDSPVAVTETPAPVASTPVEVAQQDPIIAAKLAAADASAKLAREQAAADQQTAKIAAAVAAAATPASTPVTPTATTTTVPPSSSNASFNTFASSEGGFQPRERAVPASPLARIAGFSQIASNIFFGTIKDKVTGAFSETDKKASATNGAPKPPSQGVVADSKNAVLSSFLSEANTERLAEGLCRMRGAALKVGQMLSIQDESLVPPQLQAVLDRVRDGADVMPRHQLEKALMTELGPNWMDQLSEFDWKPMAAASIGQVHRARLKSNGQEVVMKVQYPGVAESINSDVNNLKRLIRFVNVLPKGMYIDETMRAAKEELALECDYSNEALAQKKFKKLADGDKAFYIPQVIDSLSTKRILTTERVYGVAIDRLTSTPPVAGQQGPEKIVVSEAVRNSICRSLLRLCLNELFSYRFMQTDPNWSNFLYNPTNNLLYLIDFGASRLYRKQFVDEYLRMVYACSIRDRRGIIDSNIKLGFLTGEESKEMIEATVQAGYIIGEPFGSETPYDFVEGNIAGRVSALAGIMLRDRLTPPPKEAYTLHRKLSGAFLTCKHLQAKIQCRDDFLRVYKNHQFGPELPLEFCSASKDPIESRLTTAD